MKIAVATNAGGLEDTVSQVFGRCPTYTIVETDGNEIKDSRVIPNPAANAGGGAGIQAAQLLVNEGATAALAGSFGPNASGVLAQAGIKMVPVQGIPVKEAAEKFLKGELGETAAPTGAQQPAYGGGQYAPPPAAGYGGGYGAGYGAGYGRGGGRGMGRGMGRGRGMGGAGYGGTGYGAGGYGSPANKMCRCPNCGYTENTAPGVPCQTRVCPNCGTRLMLV